MKQYPQFGFVPHPRAFTHWKEWDEHYHEWNYMFKVKPLAVGFTGIMVTWGGAKRWPDSNKVHVLQDNLQIQKKN
jgi:hypothetical protein